MPPTAAAIASSSQNAPSILVATIATEANVAIHVMVTAGDRDELQRRVHSLRSRPYTMPSWGSPCTRYVVSGAFLNVPSQRRISP